VFHGKSSLFDDIIQIEEQVPDSPEVRSILEFLRATKLGIIAKI
jgi:UDP-N-acetylglucosamine acyltransferase